MTPANFLSELHDIQTGYTWFLTNDGRIRATFGAEVQNRVFDPITAVAFAQTGEFFPEGEWARAAAAIGMSLDDCADFVAACNFAWDPSCRQGTIRHDVLTAIRMVQETDVPSNERSSLQLFAPNYRKRSAGSTKL